MKKNDYQVVWRGFVHDNTGYAKASRGYLLALDRLGVDVKVEPLTYGEKEIMLGSDEESARILELIKKPYSDGKLKVLIYHAQPDGINVEDMKKGFDYVIINTVWETTKVPDKWKESSLAADAIFVPSKFNTLLFEFEEAGTHFICPTYLCPHGSDVDLYNPDNPPLPITDVQGKFTFLSVFDWQHRKAPEVLLESYWREFTAEEDVVMILKTYVGGKEAHNQLIQFLLQYKQRLGITHETAPILLALGRFTEENMASLYTTADAFVLPTRGEGVGLPFIEAMSSGIPVIATKFGGQRDFVNEENGYLIDFDLDPVRSKMDQALGVKYENLFTEGMLWGEPRLESVRAKMREAYENQDQVKEKGILSRKAMEQMTWDMSGEIMKKNIESVIGEGK